MRDFPLFVGDVVEWISQAIQIQQGNTAEVSNFKRVFQPQQQAAELDWSADIALDFKKTTANLFFNDAVDADRTITATNVPNGKMVVFMFTNNSGSNRTITLGTGFSAAAGITTAINAKTRSLIFIGHGGELVEISTRSI